MTTPVMRDQWGVALKYTGITYVIGGAVSFVAIFIFARMGKMDERKPTMLVLVLLLCGAILMTDFQAIPNDPCLQHSCLEATCNNAVLEHQCVMEKDCFWVQNGMFAPCSACSPICRDPKKTLDIAQFTIGYCFTMLSSTIGRSSVSTLFANLLGPHKQVTFIFIDIRSFGNFTEN